VLIGRGGRADEAVGIAQGNDGKTRVARQDVGRAVADRLAGLAFAHLDNGGFERHRRHHRILAAVDGAAAVERDAGAHHLEVHLAAGHRRGGVGERGGHARELRHHRAEQRQLRAVLLMLRLVGTREVAHDHLRRVADVLDHPLDDRGFAQAEAEPVHAGVEVERRGQGLIAAEASDEPLLEHGHGVEHRHQPLADIERRRAGEQPIEHEDVAVGHGRPEREALVGRCDKEEPRSSVVQCLADRHRADAIAIGLHRGAGEGAGRHLVESQPVALNSAEVDREPRAVTCDDRRRWHHSNLSGRYWSGARLPKRVNWPSKLSCTVPVGP
jgi:hypothetical protein